MESQDGVKDLLNEQIRLIGKEIKRRIEKGNLGNGEDILNLAQAQQIMLETKKMF